MPMPAKKTIKKIKVPEKRIEKEMLASPTAKTQTWRIFEIMAEFVTGFELLSKYKKAVSFFGSARCSARSNSYQEAAKLAKLLSKDGYAVITGGASGIMEAANKGAYEAGGPSVGINIKLPEEQNINKYVKDSEDFQHFFVRKVMLAFASQVYIFFPGGFGTLDEFFEMLTLVQTEKIHPIPIILVGRDFWEPLDQLFRTQLYQKFKTISRGDLKLYYIVDDASAAHKLIKRIVSIKK